MSKSLNKPGLVVLNASGHSKNRIYRQECKESVIHKIIEHNPESLFGANARHFQFVESSWKRSGLPNLTFLDIKRKCFVGVEFKSGKVPNTIVKQIRNTKKRYQKWMSKDLTSMVSKRARRKHSRTEDRLLKNMKQAMHHAPKLYIVGSEIDRSLARRVNTSSVRCMTYNVYRMNKGKFIGLAQKIA